MPPLGHYAPTDASPKPHVEGVAPRRSPVWQRVASEFRRELVERLNRLFDSGQPASEFGTVEWPP